MEREHIKPRADKAEKLESVGLSFHGWDDYWKEDVCYKFTADQVDVLEEATDQLHKMCMIAVEHVITNNRFAELAIPEAFWEPIRKSFTANEFTLYGRFDFAYDGVNPPKMLEYNADTPTSLLESSVAQWYWLQDVKPHADQFNSLHERLVLRWKEIYAGLDTIYFASIGDNEEDWVCTHYLMETAIQAGFQARHIYIEDLGWSPEANGFIDLDGNLIPALFKLYPWEWMMREEFGANVHGCNTKFIEPMWKAVLSNKGILPILWELFPDHPNLLAAYFEDQKHLLSSYAKKPLFSREGANIELYQNGLLVDSDEGPYGEEGAIYQQLVTLPEVEGRFPIIGSWVIGDQAAGMCVREDVKKITTNMSNFIPHYFE